MLGVLVAVLLPLASAGRASASVPGLEQVGAQTVSDSTYSKTVTVACPAGKRVLGVGGEIAGGGKSVLIHQIAPDATLTSVTVKAVEYAGGTTQPWSAAAFAMCATPPPGLTLTVATTAQDSTSPKSATVYCPTGKQLTGTGVSVAVATRIPGLLPDDVAIEALTPKAGLTGVRVEAFETQGDLAAGWSLQAYAICASPLPGLELRSTTGTMSTTSKSATALCSAGKKLLGTGADVAFANSDVAWDWGQVVLTSLRPGAFGLIAAASPDPDGTLLDWSLRAHAICATA